MIPLFQVSMDVPSAIANVSKVLSSGYIGEGKMCAQLESDLAPVLGFERVLLVNSGTSALQLALHLAGARSRTEVITTPQTCLATSTAIAATGAKIVWADINPKTGNIDPDDVLSKVTSRTRAVVAVDWAGRLCELKKLRDLLRGISVVEDAAHAFGADRPAGQWGDFTCWSFQAIKHFTTVDGGAIATPGLALHERGRLLRWFGLDRTRGDAMRCYQSVSEWGWKYQSNDVSAAIGLANLPGAIGRVEACRTNARFFRKRLENVPYIELPPPDDGASWWIYTVRVSQPARFERFMADKGISVGQVHARNDLYPCFSSSRRSRLTGVDDFNAHQSNIPCGWHVSTDDLEEIAQAIEDWSQTLEARW